MLRKALLVCGIASSLLYAAMTVLIAMQWDDYNWASQTISELSAIDAPTRSLWVLPGAFYTVLVIAFGWGVWSSAGRNHALRIAGSLLLAYGSLGLLWPFAPMHLREVLAAGGGTLSDTMHLVLANVTVLLMLLAIMIGSLAFGKRFRNYSIASLAILFVFGALTFLDAPRVGSNLPTPWIGVWERINIGVFLLWVVVLATTLLRRRDVELIAHPRQPGSTPPFRAPTGAILAGSIADARYYPIGGINQWVMIRGENLANPPLILLHGGPGFSETTLFRCFNAPLEKSFTVVYWDQRGAGKSFDPTIPKSSMTVAQFIDDLDELVDAVRLRLGKQQVAIFGHSWGSALGVLYAARFPDKVAAYVGSGQIGDAAAGDAASYAFALAEAQRLDNQKALRQLRAIGEPPYTPGRLWTERMWLQRLDGLLSARGLWKMRRMFFGGAESSILDLVNGMRGFKFSLDAMWAEVSRLNLLKAAPVLQMPVFFFLGRRDHWVPPETSVAYYHALTASKTLVWFEKSGHEPFMDEPAAFNRPMVELVRPVFDHPGDIRRVA